MLLLLLLLLVVQLVVIIIIIFEGLQQTKKSISIISLYLSYDITAADTSLHIYVYVPVYTYIPCITLRTCGVWWWLCRVSLFIV